MRPAFGRRELLRRSTKVEARYTAFNDFHYVLMNPCLSAGLTGERNPARTLYDLLGARADTDAEGLRRAFRQAVKANHPDLHAGDPDAPIRFRLITEAYKILRDPEQRATYDRLLWFERFQRRWNFKRTISYLMQDIVSDAIAVAGLAIVLAGGYMLFAQVSKAPFAESAGIVADEPDKIAAVQTATRTDATEPDKRREELERGAVPWIISLPDDLASAANDGGALEVTKGAPDPSSAGPQTGSGKPDNDFAPLRDQADVTPATGRSEGNYRIEPLDRDKAQSGAVKFSSLEKANDIPNSPLPNFTMSDAKHDIKISDARDTNLPDVKMPDVKIPDVKIPEIKMPGRSRTAAKRRPTGRPFEQASLENKNTSACPGSQSCSRDLPPLFGVGF